MERRPIDPVGWKFTDEEQRILEELQEIIEDMSQKK